ESLLLGFRKKAGAYDFQAEHHMVVGAGSRHHTGLIYEAVERSILPCPPWLTKWVRSTADIVQAKRSGHGDGDAHPVIDSFEFADLCAHYAPLFGIVGNENNYYWPDPCPWTDHRHEHSPNTGFYW